MNTQENLRYTCAHTHKQVNHSGRNQVRKHKLTHKVKKAQKCTRSEKNTTESNLKVELLKYTISKQYAILNLVVWPCSESSATNSIMYRIEQASMTTEMTFIKSDSIKM